ncbi:MAG: ATP-binding protein [Candidatus Coatesbacteria bacterium]|nr:ATP-binding protein [Candidatus Coatesbacteria bacterium]
MHSHKGPAYNPFSPDLPVPPHLLAGRHEALSQIEAALSATALGKPGHLLVVSEPWLGKTSLALCAERLAQHHALIDAASEALSWRFTPLFCSMGACTSLTQVAATIMDEALRRFGSKDALSLRRLLGRVKGLKLGPFGIELESRKEKRAYVVSAFPHLVVDILARPNAECAGQRAVLLMLDDVQHIARTDGAAHLVRTMVELLSREGISNVMLMMAANPADVELFCTQDDSFASIFRSIRLGRLTAAEVAELLTLTARHGRPSKAFTDDAIERIANLSAGYPGFVQQLGHAAFELCPGPLIDAKIVRKALFGTNHTRGALASVADKHFRHLLDLQPVYARILDAIDCADHPLICEEIKRFVPEIKNLGPFLRKLMNRTAIRKLAPPSRPRYAIAAPVVSLWLHLQRVLGGRALR